MYSSVNELFADEIAELKGIVASKDNVIADQGNIIADQSKQIEYLKGLLRLYNIPESDYNSQGNSNE